MTELDWSTTRSPWSRARPAHVHVVVDGRLEVGSRLAERDAGQIEVLDDGRQIIGHRVEVVTAARPIGATVTAPVVDDATQSGRGEGGNLVIPLVRPQSPSMDE